MSDDNLISLGADANNLPTRADAVQNRADILQVAQRLFQQHGVEQVSMSQIAREAQVGKGTLYRHFRSKPELCHALLDNEQRAFQDRVFCQLRDSSEAPVDKLRWFLRQAYDYTGEHIDLLFETTQGRVAQGRLELDHPAHHWQWMTIRGLLMQIEMNGDVEYMADVFYAQLDSRFYYFQRYVRGYEHERLVDGVLDLVNRLFS